MLESGELGSKRSVVQKQPHGDTKLEQQDEESEAPVSDASHHAAYAHLLNAVFGPPASFIVNVPVGSVLQYCVLDVAPVGWCNPYQWLDDARTVQYSHDSVSDGGRQFFLSRHGRFVLRLGISGKKCYPQASLACIPSITTLFRLMILCTFIAHPSRPLFLVMAQSEILTKRDP